MAHKKSGSKKAVRVGGEVGVTICVSPETNEYLKISFWHERISPDDSQVSLRKTEELINEFNEAILEKRLKQYKRLFRRER